MPANRASKLTLKVSNRNNVRTVALDFASQSLTCFSTAVLCVPVKVLTFIAPPVPAGGREWGISPRRLSVFLGDTFRLVARRARCSTPS